MARKNAKKTVRRNQQADPPVDEAYTLHLVAGATGDLLHRLASVAATQFSGAQFTIVPHPMNDQLEKLERTLDMLTGERPIVVHALADSAAKQMVRTVCLTRRIPHFDATGPLVDFLADCVGALPDNDLSRLHRVDAAYQRRIDAMEFALAHDDGLGLSTLGEADIVIVGVSRVSKSPTTLYLASRGFKVANVSIAPQTGFPKELARVKRKVVALSTQPKRLQEIRTERRRQAGVEMSDYDHLPSVVREVMDAELEYRARGYPVIDVTNLTIEQTATQILKHLKLTVPK